jgi:hypothetical protein
VPTALEKAAMFKRLHDDGVEAGKARDRAVANLRKRIREP